MNRLISEVTVYGKPAKVITDEEYDTCISRLQYVHKDTDADVVWYLGTNIVAAHDDAVGYWRD